MIAILSIFSFLMVLALLSQYQFEVRADTIIDAPPEKVWNALVQMDCYKDWNEQLQFLGGSIALGEKVNLKLSVDGAKPYEFSPTIIHWEESKKFGWIARTGLPGIFDGEHLFELEGKEEKTFLVNRERYRGILAPIIQIQPMMKNAPKGFEKMNTQLKNYVESLNN